VEKPIGPIEKVIRVKRAPVVASSFIHKVDPNTTSWPAMTYEVILVWCLDKNIRTNDAVGISGLVSLESLVVHWIRFLILDVRVRDHYEAPV